MEPLTTVESGEVTQELERILTSRAFSKAQRSQKFLRYLVEVALTAGPAPVKEYTVAIDVFDRGSDYDPTVDATVRVEAGRLRNRLREYYAEEGSQATLIIEVPKGQYAAVIYPSPDHKKPPPLSPLPQTSAEQSGDPERSQSFKLLLVCVSVAAIVAAFIWGFRAKLFHPIPSIRSLAVLPLKNLSGSPDQDYFAEGMTDELNTELAQIPNLRVVSRDSVMQENAERKPLSQIKDDLQVDAVVEGSVVRSGDRVRINTQLIDTRSNSHLWSASFEGSSSDMLSLQDDVARAIASHAKLISSPATSVRGNSFKQPNADAYDAYLHGRYFFDKREARRSADFFEQAVVLDPTFAAAYAGLANAINSQITLRQTSPGEGTPRALAAGRRAIELDPNLGEAYTALGTVELDTTWDWKSAQQHLLRGIQLSPGDSLPHVMYSYYLDAMDRPDEAVAHMRQAAMMDPLSFFVARNLGSALYYARDYDGALKQLFRARAMQPERSTIIDNWISWAYQMKGMRDEAIQYDLKVLEKTEPATNLDRLHKTYQRNGWKAYWLLRATSTHASADLPCLAYDRATKLVRAEVMDEALAAFNSSVDERCFWMAQIGVDPRFDDLRKDPRFPALAARIGLAPGGQVSLTEK